MDFELTVLQLLPVVTGQSARGEWKKQEVIFEQPGEYSRKLCVGFWNDRAVDAANLQPGDRVALSVNVESREYNGRWYNDIRAWRIETAGVPVPPYQAPGAAPSGSAPLPTIDDMPADFGGNDDDLPF